MLSGFFDDAQDEDSKKSQKKQNAHKPNSSSNTRHTSTNSDKKYKSDEKNLSHPQRKPKYQDDFKTKIKKKNIPKKYPSPPRPPLPPLKPIKNVKKYPQKKSNEALDQSSNKPSSLQFTEGNIMDNLLTYQKKLIDKVSNFRTESIKQIDLMIGEIDKINYSKYSKK